MPRAEKRKIVVAVDTFCPKLETAAAIVRNVVDAVGIVVRSP
ncbi:MAG: hypothetical protein R3E58_08800 [Phycisphaerae bacterium]